MKFKFVSLLFALIPLFQISAEDKFYFDLLLTYTQKSDYNYATVEKYSLKNNRLTYEWKYTGLHPNIDLPREIKRTILLKHTKKMEEFLDKNHLLSDMNIRLYSKRLPQDNYQTDVSFNIYHQNRSNSISIKGLRPIDDEKNREYDLVLEFMDILKKELGFSD